MATWGQGLSLKGATGATGARGSLFTVTDGLPTDSNATNQAGDFALDSTTQLLYTRGSGGWPTSSASGVLLKGAMGVNGINGSFFAGSGAPTTSTYNGDGQAVYLQTNGQVWIYQSKAIGWVDTGENWTGPQGPSGSAGTRGTQTYNGNGAPSSDLQSFSPPAVAGDLYYDLQTAGGPYLHVLGS